MRRLAAALCVAALGFGLLAGIARAEDERQLTEAARGYLDPELEFRWRPRKVFLQALADLKERTGRDALVDLGLLLEIAMQGRHFLPPFDDRKWRRENEIIDFEKDGLYVSLVSEARRFTYCLPEDYPSDRALGKVPRPAPLPFLLAIHEALDGRAKYPGAAVLKRRYPRDDFEDLYDDWLILAPVAARAKFLEDGAIRHRFLTAVLTDFWRRYHVDFDRIVVDGGAPAAALAAAFPHVLAGLVLRPGQPIDLDVVVNYASVPVFVAGDDALARELEQAGHPDVTVGDDEALLTWLTARRRVVPTRFRWRWKRPDHGYAQWIVLTKVDEHAPEVGLAVEALDTEDDPNTIRIDARGVERLNVYLNDDLVDLDRPVRLDVNGEVRELGLVERDFDRLFYKDPDIRHNMNFGWLYTALLEDVAVPAPGPAPFEPEPAPAPAEPGPDLPARLAAQQEWMEGRPDRIEAHVGDVTAALDARALLPFALRDLWWRPTGDEALRARCEAAARTATDEVLADQLRWILAGGGAPYPRHADPVQDPWPLLTALVRERRQRETTGARWLPDESPVLRRRVLDAPVAWQDWYARWCAWFYEERMRTAYEGEDPERVSEAFAQADEEQARLAEDVRGRNAWLAVLAGALFVGGAFVLGRRASQA